MAHAYQQIGFGNIGIDQLVIQIGQPSCSRRTPLRLYASAGHLER
jgi:hypothetical protein